MITGGTGSFGNAVLKRFLETGVKEIRVFSRDEKKQEDMRIALNNPKLKFYIGDVRVYDTIYDALKGVNYVFHAAALKQVPSCEFYPMEAVRTNMLGAENVMNAAIANQVERVHLAEYGQGSLPHQCYGYIQGNDGKANGSQIAYADEGETVICATRYGNVMGSRGSVIPLFRQSIQGRPALTITDPTMTRFLMSLEDSVDLVIYAFEYGHQGDIFVQKAPASTIETLAALQGLFVR